jgi:hypothetical protein
MPLVVIAPSVALDTAELRKARGAFFTRGAAIRRMRVVRSTGNGATRAPYGVLASECSLSGRYLTECQSVAWSASGAPRASRRRRPAAPTPETRGSYVPLRPAEKIALSCCQTAVPKESDVAMGMRASPASFDEAVIVRRIDALSVEITYPCEPDVATTRWSDVR